MAERDEGRERVRDLVRRFGENSGEYTRSGSDYNETQLRTDFLNPFLQALGWDVLNEKRAPQHLREVVHEDIVQVDDDESGTISKKPDYAFRVGLERKFFLEAKKPSVSILTSNRSAFQVRRYGWNARMPVSILTNFHTLVIYDCHQRPDYRDDAAVARLKTYTYTEYVDKFDEIYDQFSREAVYSGAFDTVFGTERQRPGTERFDQYFLQQIERWRRSLAEDLITLNPTLQQDELNFLVQRLIDRIIFLRVCEDRELEKYEALRGVKTYQDLKGLFVRADERYNSGLFDFLEDRLSLKVELGSDVLVQIFKELYFPESPYAFAVVETDVISEIYEIFLGKLIELEKDGRIRIAEKPEVVESSGIVPTPKYIVDTIVQRTLAPLCQGKTPTELSLLRLADIACGSGSFLLAAYEYLLNYHLEWYISNGPGQHTQEVYEGAGGSWYLTLYEKQRILLNAIYGVDLDIQAVEVTQFSLLLKVLENETAAAVQAHLSRHRLRALPNLSHNIQWGNSLVDTSFLQFDEDISTRPEQFAAINPFDWAQSFPRVMAEGGFDMIIGNPPYIRIQNMVRYSSHEVKYYQSRASPYLSAKSDNFDKYALFIERSLFLLKPSGRLGYIVPNKFYKIRSGAALRKLLSSQQYLSEIINFGVQQVFEGQTTTYTCILILNKAQTRQVRVEHVDDLQTWRYSKEGRIETLDAGLFSERAWMLVSPQVRSLFDRLEQQNPRKLGEASDIFVGLQTSSDKIYILRPQSETGDTVTFTDMRGGSWTIEKAILRPCLYDAEVKAFSRPVPNAMIIFPYKVTGEQATLYTQDEMQQLFPLCWNYLNAFKDQLLRRHDPRRPPDAWYRYGRSQSLTRFNGEPKLIWSTLSLEARYAYDDRNIVFTGGGNGPYYALRQRRAPALSLYYLLAILAHPVFDMMVQVRASQFRGGYSSYGKQFIQNIPIREIDFARARDKTLYERVVQLVQQLIKVTDAIASANLPKAKIPLTRQAEMLKKQIDQLIEELYGIGDDDMKLVRDLIATNVSVNA